MVLISLMTLVLAAALVIVSTANRRQRMSEFRGIRDALDETQKLVLGLERSIPIAEHGASDSAFSRSAPPAHLGSTLRVGPSLYEIKKLELGSEAWDRLVISKMSSGLQTVLSESAFEEKSRIKNELLLRDVLLGNFEGEFGSRIAGIAQRSPKIMAKSSIVEAGDILEANKHWLLEKSGPTLH